MSQVRSPKELFKHELQDMYYAEKALATTLPKLAQEASDAELTRAFTSHQKETEKHVVNLEKVFEHLGQSAQAHPCPGIDGIKKEHDDFMRENTPTPKMRDAFLTGAAARTEHYEIAAYTGLVKKAKAMGQTEVADLLEKNLRQERNMLRQIEKIEDKLNKQVAAQR